MATIFTTCPECGEHVEANIIQRPESLEVRGERVDFIANVAVCSFCNSAIGDLRVDGDNLKKAYDIYREQHSFLSPDEITALRKRYDLSLREFARFLGFGEQTITRYENGALPDRIHMDILHSASTAKGARELLEKNSSRISDRSRQKVVDFIENSGNSDTPYSLMYFVPSWMEGNEVSERTGYTAYDPKKAQALVCVLADKCKNLFVTKMQKAMFITDSLAYELLGHSISGVVYVHATHGPIIDSRQIFLAEMQGNGAIELEEYGDGEIVKALMLDTQCLTAEELDVVNTAAEFVNTFSTSSAISDFSHTLDAWKSTGNGKTINYGLNFGEIEKAVSARLS